MAPEHPVNCAASHSRMLDRIRTSCHPSFGWFGRAGESRLMVGSSVFSMTLPEFMNPRTINRCAPRAACLIWLGIVASAVAPAWADTVSPAAGTDGHCFAGSHAIAIGGPAAAPFESWGQGKVSAWFSPERLPAVFRRTIRPELTFQSAPWDWSFTGPRAGLTIKVRAGRAVIQRRHWDSTAFQTMRDQPARHPWWHQQALDLPFDGPLRSIEVLADSDGMVRVEVNGSESRTFPWTEDLIRHQIRIPADREFRATIDAPGPEAVTLQVHAERPRQTMIGFGGIASMPAYHLLPPAARQEWWRLLRKYNLLIQREYPVGRRLNREMNNWDDPAEAVPHYYGDNFPNGELSDFAYLRELRRQGGQIWFEFWGLPEWVGDDDEAYARAMINYCLRTREATGRAPEIVGIQNEVHQSAERWHSMTRALRAALNHAGLHATRIHMSDAATLKDGLRRLEAFQSDPEVWKMIDFTATHMYDAQDHFHSPRDFDPLLVKWREQSSGKPFLSTELCVNDNAWQLDSYRGALPMARLYHQNLAVADAAAVLFCWTLLNVEQPSYGWTRSLFVPDESRGGTPVASSHQLRLYGAWSRRIHAGMRRLETSVAGASGLLASAWQGNGEQATVVAYNPTYRPLSLAVDWPGKSFTTLELADPWHQNVPAAAPGPVVRVPPGAIVTLTNVPLLEPAQP